MLLQVNRESRSFTLRTYHLSFDAEELLNRPKYFNNAKDTLHVVGFYRHPWLSNTSAITEEFKKIRYLNLSSGFGYYLLWLLEIGLLEEFLKCFPALEGFNVRDTSRFGSSSVDDFINAIKV